MADKTKTTSTLVMVGEFADGDDRTLNQDNPDTSSLASLTAGVCSLEAFCKNTQVIIGDKTGAAFKRFRSAKVVNKTTTLLDLN
ncbi:MAG: hypothetical protein IKT98_10385 [Selenomonadaceae bacterium]|nr:hypothetical protein [Selenomonadaceae bacterium]